MNEKILQLSESLKKALDNDERISLLNESEKRMNESEEVMSLAYQKDRALDDYNEMLKYFSDDSEEVKSARKELAEAKKTLEEHELVRDYLKKYQQVRMLFERINNTLFAYLNNDLCPEENR